METETDRRLSPLGLTAVGLGFCAALGVLTVIAVKMAPPVTVATTTTAAPPSDDFGPTDGAAGALESVEGMCAAMLKDRADLMDQCRQEEEEAMQFVNSYLQNNGMLTDDGSIDTEKLADAESDPLGAVDSDPGSIIAYCLQNSPDWIATGECITSLDSDAAYQALRPDAGSPGLDGLGDDGSLSGGGAN